MNFFRRSSRSCHCSCLPITLRSAAVATWINHAISPSPSQSSDGEIWGRLLLLLLLLLPPPPPLGRNSSNNKISSGSLSAATQTGHPQVAPAPEHPRFDRGERDIENGCHLGVRESFKHA